MNPFHLAISTILGHKRVIEGEVYYHQRWFLLNSWGGFLLGLLVGFLTSWWIWG